MAGFKAVMLRSALVQVGCMKRRIGKERGEDDEGPGIN